MTLLYAQRYKIAFGKVDLWLKITFAKVILVHADNIRYEYKGFHSGDRCPGKLAVAGGNRSWASETNQVFQGAAGTNFGAFVMYCKSVSPEGQNYI